MVVQPVTLATQKAEIGRIVVGGQPNQKIKESPSEPTIKKYIFNTIIPNILQNKVV
jgi:hypothetical protein